MKRLSSVLAQDKRFWKLSAKHAVVRLWQRVDEDRLLSLEEDEEFDEKFPNTQLSDTYINGMDWRFFSQLILHSFLIALAELHGETAEGLSRFNELKRQAGQVSGIVTYAHFIDRLDEMIWEDELVERVTAKSFVDAMIAVAEGRASGLSPPDPEPDWRPIESEVRISILRGNASVIPPLTFNVRASH